MAARIDPPDARRQHGPAPGGLAGYLARHASAGRPFATVTGAQPDAVVAAVRSAVEGVPSDRIVWLPAPLPTGRALLVAILAELGLAPPPAGLDELHNLLVVYLRHEARRQRHTLIVLAAADRCGPCVFDLLQTLARVPGGSPGSAAVTVVLCGGPALNRILDSPGMAGTRPALRERFDVDRRQPWLARAPLFAAPAAARPPLPPGAGAATIELLLDGTVEARFSLPPGRTTIGRDPASGIRIASRYVSRRHAVVVRDNGVARLLDLRSRNGTLVNGRRVTEHRLVDQDLVGIGHYRLRYRCPGG